MSAHEAISQPVARSLSGRPDQREGRGLWSDVDDEIIGGDLTAALAYVTPAGGAVLTPVAPIGLRDREAGTVAFTTSLGFGRKLDRIKANPRVALAYHAREHGFATVSRFVLVQATATYDTHPDPGVLAETVRPASTRFMGEPRTGLFWDRWLGAYYADRVLVTVKVHRVLAWPDLACRGDRSVGGHPAPSRVGTSGSSEGRDRAKGRRRARREATEPASSRPGGLPRGGRVPDDGAGDRRRCRIVGHRAVRSAAARWASRRSPRPFRYQAKLIGLETRQYTGWLKDGVYAPHTENGFRAPANKTLLLLGNGFMARRGLKQARARGRC
jgi:hypothetical protein